MLVLSTDSLRGYGLNRIFQFAKDAEYDGIDISVDFGQFDTHNADYINNLIKEYDLPVHAISAPNEISEKNIKEIVKLAKKVNAKIIILQPPKILNFKFAGWLRKEIPKLREKEEISIALENAPAGTFLGFIPEHAMSNIQELKKFKHISLDTARIGEKRQDLIRAYTSFRKYLVHIHLSNLHRGKKYSCLRDGILPLESFLTKLKQEHYPGALSIKILPKNIHAGDDDRLIKALKEEKEYYDKYFTKVEAPPEEEESEKS